jgi:hypothetical protein
VAELVDARDFLAATHNQLWFEQSGNDLVVDLLAANGSADMSGWYSGNAGAQVTSFTTADALKLGTQVAQPVRAMASYGAENSGFDPTIAKTMPTAATLQDAIAAAWPRQSL